MVIVLFIALVCVVSLASVIISFQKKHLDVVDERLRLVNQKLFKQEDLTKFWRDGCENRDIHLLAIVNENAQLKEQIRKMSER